MIQNPFDFVSVSVTKSSVEFEVYQNKLFNQSNIEFPNRKSGRITGEILPDSVDPNGKWIKHYLTTPERDNIKFTAIETEFLLSGNVNYDIKISCSPPVSINNGKNNKPVSLKSFNEFIDRIEEDYCIKADELIIHRIERSFLVEAEAGLAKSFIEHMPRFLVFKGEVCHLLMNDQTNEFMGFVCNLTHFYFKFYFVDKKYNEILSLFRIERSYKRMATFKKSTGVETLDDLRSLNVALKCAKKTLEDWDDVIISDPTIKTSIRLSKKERNILINSHDSKFWQKAKKERDNNTYRDWVNTFRNLSDDYGDGFHTKIRNSILEQIVEIENEIRSQIPKNSSDVTCNYEVITNDSKTNNCYKLNKEMNQEKEISKKSKKQLNKEKVERRDIQFQLFIRALAKTLQQIDAKKYCSKV